MFRSLHIAATGMAAQETQLETVSNNIANANTVGYKKQRADFQDLLYQTIRAAGGRTGPTTVNPTGLQVGSGVKVVTTARLFGQGAIQNTDNPLDLAVEGGGFFVVQQHDGTQAFTRAGNLRTDPDGRLVTPEGLPVEPGVTIPPDATAITISSNGTVSVTMAGQTDPVEVGQLQLATFVNPAGLQGIGHNLLVASGASGEPQIGEPGRDGRGTLLQGSLERANVDVVEEMIGLISSQRNYEVNSKVIAAADEMLRSATQMR